MLTNMFLQGVARIDNVINPEQRKKIKEAIINAFNNKILTLEDDAAHYKNSYGTASLPQVDEIYSVLTPLVSSITGLELAKENSYSRIYNEGSTLNRHLDREGLDITVSMQIDNSTGLPQPIFCQNYSGDVMEASLNDGDMVILRGRDLYHWRNPLQTAVQGGQLICSFFHWKIVGKDIIIKDNFLSNVACETIIEQAELEGFEKSQVIKEGQNVHDDYSRSSSTVWFKDTWHITDMLHKYIPEIKKLKVEGWQLLRYNTSEEFKAHFDCLSREKDRLFTVLIYLNDNFEGGETQFVNKKVTINPLQGRLIMWKNLSSGKCDPLSLHAGNPVKSGTKYILVNWLINTY
jgi:hypothetical protein